MDQSNEHYPWTLIGMARHGVPTFYLYSTFVSQDLVGIFDWNVKKKWYSNPLSFVYQNPALLEFKVFQTMQVHQMVMFDHVTCTF
jgi:hypothetical protein